MRRIPADTLLPSPSLPRPLFHESGALLLGAGERLGEEEIGLLRRCGIKRVYDVGAPPEPDTPAEPAVAFAPGAPEPSVPPEEVRAFRRERRLAAAARAIERGARLAEGRLVLDPRGELRNGGIDRVLARSRAGERPEGTPWKDRLEGLRPEAPRPAREKAAALEMRGSIIARLAAVFGALRAGGGLPGGEASLPELARDLGALILRDPDLAVALALLARSSELGSRSSESGEPAGEADLLARHSFATAVLATIAGIEMGYALEQLFEIGWAALFHDVGMVRLPEALARKRGPLDDEERRELERHPLHAIEVLRRFPEVPVALAAVAIEEHERLDGTGYPRATGEPGDLARIVAVADVFEALASDRPHRPARPLHAAVRELVALGAKRKLDARVLRALLKGTSLYPIGSYLRLSDGAVARVIRPGGPDASRPTVAVIGAAAPPPLLDLAQRPDLRVIETDLPGGATGGLLSDDALVGF